MTLANEKTFEAINAQLLKAEQALQVQSHLPNLLAELDQDLLQKRAELSKLVTDLKWKKYALDKSRKRTIASIFYGFLGRRKGWQTAVKHAYVVALSHYEECKKKIDLLQSERKALDQQLLSLAGSEMTYQAVRRQQIDFIFASYSGEEAGRLMRLTQRLQQARDHSEQIGAALLAGRNASAQSQAFFQRLKNPLSLGERLLMDTSEVWLLPAELLARQSVIIKLSAFAEETQKALDNFQQKLTAISWQFWPALSIMKPASHSLTLEQLIKWWLNRLQENKIRLTSKITQLEEAIADLEKTTNRLEAEQNQLIDSIWTKENFPQN